MLERRDSARQIAELEHSNLFVQPLDRRREWYRYHHLFQEALRAELARREPRSVAALHRRASRWHEREGTPEEAVQHALAAKEVHRATELVVQMARGLVNVGRLATVRRWLDAFPDDDIARLGAAGPDRRLGIRAERREGPGATVRLARRRRALARAGPRRRAVARVRPRPHQGACSDGTA